MPKSLDQYPHQIQQALAPISALSLPPRQGMTSFVTFAETRLGAVAIKRAAGPRLAGLRREKMVLETLRGSPLLVPEFIQYIETKTGQVNEGWLVMSRLPGEPLVNVLSRTDQANTRTQLLVDLGRMIAQVHTLAVPKELESQDKPWLDSMLDLAETCLPLGFWEGNHAKLEVLKQQRPTPVPPTLIHGDLFLDNVLSDGIVITGLIDWSFGTAGDPRYDLVLAVDELTPLDQKVFFEGYGLSNGLSSFDTEYFLNLASFC
jgi:aminoglycoside phosphotransferase (APT) family kinase protein